MGGENDMKTWISDQLMSLLGFSQPTVVQYMIGLSKQAASPADVVSKLVVDFGLPSSNETLAFAEEMFSRVPRKKSSGLNLYQKQEREAAILARKQKTYALLDADDDEDDVEEKGGNGDKFSAGMASTPREVENHKKRFRKKSEHQEDEDDNKESVLEREDRQVRRRTTSSEDDDGYESEEERLRDQREREQLEQNIRERDAAGTRKLTEQKLSRKEEDEAIRRSKALENDGIDTLRKVSRQEYLKKREEKKLEEIRDDIEDEQYLFEGVKLTEAEYRELRYKKEIYELVKKRTDEADDIDELEKEH